MELLERINRLVKANINEIVSKAINPDEVLDQVINELKKTLAQTKQAISIATVPNTKAQLNYTAATIEAEKWQKRVQLAQESGNQNLERQALERFKIHKHNARQAEVQMNQQTPLANSLKINIPLLEKKLSEAISKRIFIKDSTTVDNLTNLNDDLTSPNVVKELEERKIHLLQPILPMLEQLLSIKKGIEDTKQTINKLKSKKSKISHQLVQTQTEVSNLHEDALQAAMEGDQTSAMQALLGEALKKQFVDILKPHIEEQENLITLLENNLAILEKAKITIEELTGVERKLDDNASNDSSLALTINEELERLRQEIDNL